MLLISYISKKDREVFTLCPLVVRLVFVIVADVKRFSVVSNQRCFACGDGRNHVVDKFIFIKQTGFSHEFAEHNYVSAALQIVLRSEFGCGNVECLDVGALALFGNKSGVGKQDAAGCYGRFKLIKRLNVEREEDIGHVYDG